MPALISAVSVELAEEGIAIGSPGTVGLGLAVGAATYFLADGLVARRAQSGGANGGSGKGEGSGKSLALGSFLDGIPEQLVLGIGLAGGEPVSVALLVAIFVSNLPEGIGASVDMKASGMPRRGIIRLFVAVAVYARSPAVSATLSPTRSPPTFKQASTVLLPAPCW